MGPEGLALQIGQPVERARELLRLHHETYATYWRWADACVSYAMLHGSIRTVFGWQVRAGDRANPRTLQNFMMQANAAEMLRLACCFAIERGVKICAPVHDALLVEAPLDELEDAVAAAERAMADASRTVLDGFVLRTETQLIRYPDRFENEGGQRMWRLVWDIIGEIAPNVAVGLPPSPPAVPVAA